MYIPESSLNSARALCAPLSLPLPSAFSPCAPLASAGESAQNDCCVILEEKSWWTDVPKKLRIKKKFKEVTSSTRTWTSLATVAAPKTSTRSAKERKFPLLPGKIHVPLAALPSSSLQDTCVLLQCLIFEFGGLYIKALFIPLSVVTPITKKTFLVTGKAQLSLKKFNN